MQLATRTLVTGDNRRYVIDYRDWLIEGAKLSTVSITVVGNVLSRVSSQSFDKSLDKVIFFLQAGNVSENFTANVQATDTLGRVINDTITFTVVTP
jgi:hypothetical protein